MDRKSFFGAALVAALTPAKLFKEQYQPIGHVAAGEPGSEEIKDVYLDGQVVKHVCEFDDVKGWLIHYQDDGTGFPRLYGDCLRRVYRTGEVRVVRL